MPRGEATTEIGRPLCIGAIGKVGHVGGGPVLIVGGTFGIGLTIAWRFAEAGQSVQLAARGLHELDTDKSDK